MRTDRFVMTYPRGRVRRVLIRTPGLGRLVLFLFRARQGFSGVNRHLRGYLKWLFRSREWTNYTYDVTDHNRRELVEFLSLLTGAEREAVRGYIAEALDNKQLSEHVSGVTSRVPFYAAADREARLGRRIGWYALVRIVKPAIVVESGIDKGLGTCTLAAALLRNGEEGYQGTVYGLDLEPGAGWLIEQPYDRVVNILVGDSHETLGQIPEPIDIFIHDSDHTYNHEVEEYRIAAERLSGHALLLSDNAHKSRALMNFAEASGLRYYFWPERPTTEFYPAGGIGAVIIGGDVPKAERTNVE